MSVAVLFPGQGSQFVGMGEELFERREDLLGAAADEVLEFSLREICLSGPEEALTRTEHAQPALFAIAYALWSELHSAGLSPDGAAGHSLGEYTALAAAGAISFTDALGAVAARGRAMAAAADLAPSGMAALLGADLETAQAVCAARQEEGGRLSVANVNAPGQVVVAGGAEDIEWLAENGREHGVRRAIPLKVAGAFHSSFMEPAVANVEAALEGVEVSSPQFPVWSNTTAQSHVAADIKATLARQVVEPVLFADSLTDMARNGVTTFLHVGPGDVTAGLAKRTLDDVEIHVVSGVDDIPAAMEAVVTI